ncbi:MAG: ComEC/Rec2 family competence protein, partial [Sarcina sp.]
IGNMDFVLKNFKVKNFLMPKTIYESTDFSNLIQNLNNKNLKIDVISNTKNHNINLGKDIQIEIFSPNTTYENLNNYSPIMKLTHYKKSFLFTGDAEIEAEVEVLNKEIDSDILKIGHHGSSSSSTQEFLKKVTPDISIISCGINNSFNHPHKSTLENLKNINSKIYRTDEDGTIVLISNGKDITKK